MKQHGPRTLGGYLVVVSALQIVGYLVTTWSPERFYWLFYYNSRLGLFLVELMVTGREGSVPGIISWISVIWVLVFGVLLFSGKRLLGTYIVSEFLFSLPNLLLIAITVWPRISPVRGFSIREMFTPALVMIVFSLVPLVWAILIMRTTASKRYRKVALIS